MNRISELASKLLPKGKKLSFPSVHLSMNMKEHLLLEEAWKDLIDHQLKLGTEDMSSLITESSAHALAPGIEDGKNEIEVPDGIDLNTVAIFQAIGLQMSVMGTIAIVEPKDFIGQVWKLSRLYYRELLRLSGIRPEGS